MEFEERKLSFQDADERYAELRRLYEDRDINKIDFDEQLKQLMVQDAEGHWWAKPRTTGQ